MPLAPVPVNNVDRSGVSGCRSVYMTSLRFASYEFQYYTLFNGEGFKFHGPVHALCSVLLLRQTLFASP